MRFLVLSDLHGAIDRLECLKPEFERADAVLCAGDFACFGKPDTGLPVLEALVKQHDTIFSVLGNCDDPAFIKKLEEYDVSVQGSMVFREGLVFAGSGGALFFTGTTPNERSDEELVSDLRIVREQAENSSPHWPNMIAIIHQPPKNTLCDTIVHGTHVGSPLIRQFIEETEPLAVITGHIHESFGIDHIGRTTIINPGALAEGRYAVLEVDRTEDGLWQISQAELCEIVQRAELPQSAV